MADELRNEVELTLGGKSRTMRMTFGAIRGVETHLKTNLIPLIGKYQAGEFGVTETATVIFYGLRGAGDEDLTLEKVGDEVMKVGLESVLLPTVEFLALAMKGVGLGKQAVTGKAES
jgi:hypothetical protein